MRRPVGNVRHVSRCIFRYRTGLSCRNRRSTAQNCWHGSTRVAPVIVAHRDEAEATGDLSPAGRRSTEAHRTRQSVPAAIARRCRTRSGVERTGRARGRAARQLRRLVPHGRERGSAVRCDLAKGAGRRAVGRRPARDRRGEFKQANEGATGRRWIPDRRTDVVCQRLSLRELVSHARRLFGLGNRRMDCRRRAHGAMRNRADLVRAGNARNGKSRHTHLDVRSDAGTAS